MNIFNLAYKQALKDYGNMGIYKYKSENNQKEPLVLNVPMSIVIQYSIYIRRYMDYFYRYSQKLIFSKPTSSHIASHKKAYNKKTIKKLASYPYKLPLILYTYSIEDSPPNKVEICNPGECNYDKIPPQRNIP